VLGETDVFASVKTSEDLKNAFATLDKGKDARRMRLVDLAKKPAISVLLEQYGLSIEEFEETFESLSAGSLHDLAWEIVSRPKDLDALLKMKREGKDHHEIWRYFRGRRPVFEQ
jgi:DNA polymerase II small subunit/DNA polymerase delta subunit B